jgi:L-histidine N-alpha-methyltransferase
MNDEPAGAGGFRRTARASRGLEVMIAEVRDGLLRQPLRELPCKYFYDDRGSALFDEITRAPEYYPTRTEEVLLAAHAEAIVGSVAPRELVELGSGAGRKVRFFLDAMRRRGRLERVQMLEINESWLRDSVAALQADYPEARVSGVVGDFVHDLAALGTGGDRLLLFLAGTLGNLHPADVPAFFRSAAAILEPGDGFVVGVDLVKDPARLHAAYNDARGVTARFNLNLLAVLNAQLGADFAPEGFEHVAFYDAQAQWIEMRLRARRAMRVRLPRAALEVDLRAGEEIRTELSCKYTRHTFEARVRDSGLQLEAWFTDAERLFASALLRRA